MKLRKILTALFIGTTFLGTTLFIACNDYNSGNISSSSVSLENEIDSLSYAIGVIISSNAKNRFINEELKQEAFFKGVYNSFKDNDSLFDERSAMNYVQSYSQKQKKLALKENLLVGQVFLAKNKTMEGVITLPSGLQYKILKEGNGPKPLATDKVKTHYHGTLIDGTVFDSSVDRGQPASFPANKVISGWIEALQLMPVGSKWKLFIPANLAYGTRGYGRKIGPNTTLIFDLELLEIEK